MQENNEIKPEETETPSEETQNTEDSPAEVVEFAWEDAEQLMQIRHELFKTQEAFSSFLLDVEKRKSAMMSRCDLLEKEMYSVASNIQEKYGVDAEYVYEMKLPTKQGEKGYFVRKDA